MIMNLQRGFEKIVAGTEEMDVRNQIDENKHEYVSDWEDEFDDVHEAYDEQGRGQAEDQAIKAVIDSFFPDIDSDIYCELHDMLTNHWCL